MNRNAVSAARVTLAAIPLYAQALAGRVGVNVVFSSSVRTASVIDGTVILPAIPLPRDENDLEAAEVLNTLMTGYTAHETGHIRHTDFSLDTGSKLQHFFVNAIEDPRMEAAFIREYAGLRGILDDMSEYLIGKDGFYTVLTEQDRPIWLLSAYTMYQLRAELRDQARFGDLAHQSRSALVAIFGESFVNRLDVICAVSGPKLRNTSDSLCMAKEILAAMEEEQQKPEDQDPSTQEPTPGSDQQGESQADGGGSPGEQSGEQSQDAQQGDASGDAGDGQAGDGDQQGGQGGKKDSSKEAAGNGQQAGAGAGGDAGEPSDQQGAFPTPSRASIAKALKEASEDSENGLRDLGDLAAKSIQSAVKEAEQKGIVGHISDDADAEVDPQAPNATRGEALGKFDASEALLYSGQLRSALQNDLKAKQRRRDHESTRGNTLNPRTIHRTSSGDRRLFLRIDDRKELNTAVMILLDVSTSMRGEPIRLAEQACFTIATALNGLSGVTTSVTTFPSYKVVLRFGDKAMREQDHFALGVVGTTPMAEAVLWAGRQLTQRREDRKILMVVTDGQPNNVAATKAQLGAVERHGIETMGIGIRLPTVGELFANHGVISSLDELTPTMMAMIGGALRAQLMAA